MLLRILFRQTGTNETGHGIHCIWINQPYSLLKLERISAEESSDINVKYSARKVSIQITKSGTSN